MFDLEKAISFVSNHGNDLEKARLEAILGHKIDQWKVLIEIRTIQNPDGGFSLSCDGLSKVSDTEFILTWLSDLALLSHEITLNSLVFLNNKQNEDGSWQEITYGNHSEVPEWKDSTNPKSILFQTANTVFWLYPFDSYQESIQKGITFLEENYTDENAYLQTKWLWAAILSRKNSWEHEKVKCLLDELLGSTSNEIPPSMLTCQG